MLQEQCKTLMRIQAQLYLNLQPTVPAEVPHHTPQHSFFPLLLQLEIYEMVQHLIQVIIPISKAQPCRHPRELLV
jgi:hypothetical protein